MHPKISEYINLVNRNANIKKIDLEKCNLTDDDLRPLMLALANKPEVASKITELFIHYNQLTKQLDLKRFTALKNLRLNNNKLIESPDLTDLRELTCVYLQHNNLKDIRHLEGLIALKSLYLHHNRLTGPVNLPHLPALQYLFLGNNDISGPLNLKHLLALRYLYLEHNKLTQAPDLTGLTNLLWVHFNNNQIETFTNYDGLTALNYLYLQNNQLTTAPDLKKLPTLKDLNIENNPLTSVAKLILVTGNSINLHNPTLHYDPLPEASLVELDFDIFNELIKNMLSITAQDDTIAYMKNIGVLALCNKKLPSELVINTLSGMLQRLPSITRVISSLNFIKSIAANNSSMHEIVQQYKAEHLDNTLQHIKKYYGSVYLSFMGTANKRRNKDKDRELNVVPPSKTNGYPDLRPEQGSI